MGNVASNKLSSNRTPIVARRARTPEQLAMAYDPATGAAIKFSTPAEDVARLARTVGYYRKIDAKHAELRAAGGTVRPDPARASLYADARRRLASARIALARARHTARHVARPRPVLVSRVGRAPRRAARRRVRTTRAASRAGPYSDGPPPHADGAPAAIGGAS